MRTRRTRTGLTELKKHEYYKILPPQLAEESDFDYILFAYYCFLGQDRSLKAMNPIMSKLKNQDITDAHGNVIRNKSSQFQWNNRSNVFDLTKVVQEIDKLIQADYAIDSEWVEKRRQSRQILQKTITTTNKLVDCYRLLVEHGLSRLQMRGISTSEYFRIAKMLVDCANGLEKAVNIIRLTWEQKENIEALEAGRKLIEEALLN